MELVSTKKNISQILEWSSLALRTLLLANHKNWFELAWAPGETLFSGWQKSKGRAASWDLGGCWRMEPPRVSQRWPLLASAFLLIPLSVDWFMLLLILHIGSVGMATVKSSGFVSSIQEGACWSVHISGTKWWREDWTSLLLFHC